MRLRICGFIRGVRQFEHFVEVDEEGTHLDMLAEHHAKTLLALPGGDKHMIEVEFLDENDPLQRFFRFGTTPQGMVMPIRITGDRKAIN